MASFPPFERVPSITRGATVTIEVDGRPVSAYTGESVAAALLAAGILVCQTHDHRPMGVFCNIGQCCSCMMTIDGTSGVRACQTPVQNGLKVETRHIGPRKAMP